MGYLEVSEIYKKLDEWDVLNKVSFCVNEGESLGIIGPSGCGKSTLLHLIAGYILPDAGNILKEGKIVKKHTKDVAFMPQQDMLLEWYTVLDNVILPLVMAGEKKNSAKKLAMTYMEAFGLLGFENAYPMQLSGGMRQRAAMLRTVLADAKLLLLDEPFGALDALTRVVMQDFLTEKAKELKLTMVLVTHDAEEALFLCDRVLVLSGRPANIAFEIEGGRSFGREWLISEDCAKRKGLLLNGLKEGAIDGFLY